MNRDIALDPQLGYQQAGLNSYLIRCYSALKFTHPTPIQFYSIKTYQSSHQSIVAQSKSGTGKTLSYISIILTHILKQSTLSNRCSYLIILPTRQLTLQVYQNLKEIFSTFSQVKPENEQQKNARHKLKQIKLLMSIGGIPFEDDRKKYLQQGGNIVVGTIGRVLDFIDKRLIKISQLSMLVLDEGDKIFESKNKKFSEVLNQIMEIKSQNQYKIQVLLYSATFNDKILQQIVTKRSFVFIQTLVNQNGVLNAVVSQNINDIWRNQATEDNSTKDSMINLQNIKKYTVEISQQNSSFFNAKMHRLVGILEQLKYLRCLVFVQKKTLLQQINERLIEAKLQTLLIHGSLSQSSRIKLMNQINQSKIILASDLLARGIDIELDLVILFDAKNNNTFWHRIGRTGRFNKMGVAISLDHVADWQPYNKESVQSNLAEIEVSFNKNKEWYGKYLTEIGNWNQTTLEKELQVNAQYKYFDEEKWNKKSKKKTMVGSERKNVEHQQKMHEIDHQLQDLSKIMNEEQLITFVQQIKSCQQCNSLITSIQELTGYSFEIKKIFDKAKA